MTRVPKLKLKKIQTCFSPQRRKEKQANKEFRRQESEYNSLLACQLACLPALKCKKPALFFIHCSMLEVYPVK
jgi:hypothetical protein